MSERLKKSLLIAAFILVVAAIAYALYYFFFRSLPTANVNAPATVGGQLPLAGNGAPPRGVAPPIVNPSNALPTTPSNPSLTPTANNQVLHPSYLTQDIASSISINPSGNGIRSYDPLDGKFYRVLDDGTRVALSQQTFFNVDQVTWGKRSDKAVLKFPDGSKTLYDFSQDKQYTLPKHWDDFDFSPQDNQIVAKSLGSNETNRFLVVASPDGSNAQYVQELGGNQDEVHSSWSPNNQVVAYATTGDPLGADRQAIVFVGLHQENFKNLIVEGRGFVPNWSPDGKQLIYSVYTPSTGYRPQLWVSGAQGDDVNANRRNIGLPTWADKCVWKNSNTVYCAVPDSLGEGAGLQRDLFANVADSLFKVDLQTNQVSVVGQLDNHRAMDHLTLSADGNNLYYTDHQNGRLAKVSL